MLCLTFSWSLRDLLESKREWGSVFRGDRVSRLWHRQGGISQAEAARGSVQKQQRPEEEARMRISRRFTAEGQSPYTGAEFSQWNSEIRNPDGTSVFRQEGIAAPAEWSSVAVDILAQKYFRKSGVPQVGPDHRPIVDKDGQPVLGGEDRKSGV